MSLLDLPGKSGLVLGGHPARPDLEAGHILVKQLGYLAEAQGAGTVLGARIPIMLTSRADTVLARMASCAVALIAARGHRAVP